jgi:hypothetical protein
VKRKYPRWTHGYIDQHGNRHWINDYAPVIGQEPGAAVGLRRSKIVGTGYQKSVNIRRTSSLDFDCLAFWLRLRELAYAR